VHKELLRDSEVKRGELQTHITHTSIKIREDTDEHRSYQEQLIAETDALRSEIQSLKQRAAQREQEHMQTVEEINTTNKLRLDQLNREHHDRVTRMSNESQDKVDRLQRENHDKLTQVT
jgi:hypothetical protein